MHELSIAISLIDVAQEEARRLGDDVRVEALRLRLGPLSGVVKEALAFSFEIASRGTLVEGARLDIEDVLVAIHCDRCRDDFELPGMYPLQCPACGQPTTDVVRGRECLLTALEVDDHGATNR